MKKEILFLLAILFSCTLWAQTPEEEYDNIAKAYEDRQQLGFQMDIELYPSYQSKKVVERQSIAVRRSADKHYNKVGELMTITNSKHQLVVDDEHKVLILGPRPKVVSQSNPIDLGSGFDELKKLIGEQQAKATAPTLSIATKGNLKGIQMDFKTSGEYEQVTIWYDSKYMIKSVEMLFANALPIDPNANPQKPRMVIQFNEYNSTAPKQSWFDFSPYVTITKKGVTKTAKYSDYTLLNNTELTAER